MNSNESIIDKIMNTADTQAEDIMTTARAKADAATERGNNNFTDAVKACSDSLQADADALLARRITVANIDAKKIILQAKADILGKVYEAAGDKIAKASDKDYLAYIESIIRHGGEDGDTVIISSRDAKRITAAFVKKIAEALKIKLTLSKDFGDFIGGVVLSSLGYDKNYTVDSELKVLSSTMSAELSQVVFKGKA